MFRKKVEKMHSWFPNLSEKDCYGMLGWIDSVNKNKETK